MGPLVGCVEAGGTKFLLGVANQRREMLCSRRLETTSPAATLADAVTFFDDAAAQFGTIAALGIASFGPVDVQRSSPTWGHVLNTPKPLWSGTDIAGLFARRLQVPVGFDTDVNAAALAESLWGASVGTSLSTYVTVGTGIGGGIVLHGEPVHGRSHTEMGHFRPRRDPRDSFEGVCPFHGDCLEGLASGPAIIARWGCSLSELALSNEAPDIIANYLGQLVVAQQALLSPERIVIGGGVMATPGLLERVRMHAATISNGYFMMEADYGRLIVHPGLGQTSGLLGGLALGQRALASS